MVEVVEAIEPWLGYVHDATTLLFGVFVSAAFLGIRIEKREVASLLGFSFVFGAASGAVSLALSPMASKQLYPLLVHVPLAVLLSLRFKQRPLACVVAVLVAYLCCQISNWVGLAVLAAAHAQWAYYLARILTTTAAGACLLHLLTTMDVQFLQKSDQSLAIFGMLPAIYYVFDYATNVYTEILHSGSVVAVEFLAFALCIFYLAFLLVYFRQYEEGEEAKSRTWMLQTQMEQSARELAALKRSERELALLRHDMRHYLTSVSTYIGMGEDQKAQELIADVVAAADRTRPERCCNNEVVNMVVSSFSQKAKETGVELRAEVAVPAELPVADVDLFALLSNALENAVAAAAKAGEGDRVVDLGLRLRDGKLLVSVSNGFGKRPVLVDGMPQASREGHGLGTRSIRYIAERAGGNCQFSLQGDRFVLRIVL